jgi:hypothetical protein
MDQEAANAKAMKIELFVPHVLVHQNETGRCF